MAAEIGDLTHGVSATEVSNYFEALKVDHIAKAVEACTDSEEYKEFLKVMAANWVGTAHDKFVAIMQASAETTASTIAGMTGALATQLTRIIEVWDQHEKSMIQD